MEEKEFFYKLIVLSFKDPDSHDHISLKSMSVKKSISGVMHFQTSFGILLRWI